MAVKYWWHIKRIKDEPIRVSEKAAQQVKSFWEAGVPVINVNKNTTINANTIAGIEVSTEVMDDNIYKLGDGILPTKEIVVMTPDGLVATNWYKKFVSGKRWENHYAHIPGYHLLERNGDQCVIAARLPEYAPARQYTEMEMVSTSEANRLDAQDNG